MISIVCNKRVTTSRSCNGHRPHLFQDVSNSFLSLLLPAPIRLNAGVLYGANRDTASPGALATLGGLRKLGASALGLGLMATALHYLGFGPQEPEAEGFGKAEAVPAGARSDPAGEGAGPEGGDAGGAGETTDG